MDNADGTPEEHEVRAWLGDVYDEGTRAQFDKLYGLIRHTMDEDVWIAGVEHVYAGKTTPDTLRKLGLQADI